MCIPGYLEKITARLMRERKAQSPVLDGFARQRFLRGATDGPSRLFALV